MKEWYVVLLVVFCVIGALVGAWVIPLPRPQMDEEARPTRSQAIHHDQMAWWNATADEAVELIKEFEGFSAMAYWDHSQYSIGYGTRANSANETVTEAEALRRLRAEVEKIMKRNWEFYNDKYLHVNQRVALVSLIYNVGQGAWDRSRCKKALGQKQYQAMSKEWLDFCHTGGRFSRGLYNRRKVELNVFHRHREW